MYKKLNALFFVFACSSSSSSSSLCQLSLNSTIALVCSQNKQSAKSSLLILPVNVSVCGLNQLSRWSLMTFGKKSNNNNNNNKKSSAIKLANKTILFTFKRITFFLAFFRRSIKEMEIYLLRQIFSFLYASAHTQNTSSHPGEAFLCS